MLREMATRYGVTPGGYLWAILEPLGMILIMSIGFSLLLRSPPLGNSFILFYATGYLPFSLFMRSSNAVMNSITFSRALLRYPAVSWIDAVLARAILNVLTDLLVAYLLMASILYLVDHRVILDFWPILQSFGLMAILAFGVGTVNCVIIGFFPVWERIWGIVTRPLFLASGVIFIYRDLPPLAQDILWWNPLMHIVSISRTGYFPAYEPQFVSTNYALLPGLILSAFGLLLLRRYHLEVVSRR
ncbi:MAG: ABC transporter permease [Pseudomonadota bacterium]